MMLTRTRTAALGLTGIAAIALTACSSVPDAQEITEEAMTNVEEASSVRLEFENLPIDSTGETTSGFMEGTTDDSYTKGELEAPEGNVEVLLVDGTGYMRADESFWESMAGPMAADLLETDKWIAIGSATGGPGFSQALESMLEEVREYDESAFDGVEGEETELDGETVYRYEDTTDEENHAVLYFTKDHELRRVEVQEDGIEGISSMDFLNWDAIEQDSAPADSEVQNIPGL